MAGALTAAAAKPRGMHLRGIGTAAPDAVYTKAQCLAAFRESAWYARLEPRARFIAQTVLQRDNGIDERRLAVASLADVFTIDADTLDARFALHAPALAATAGRRALAAAAIDAQHIDAVVVSTCTGYLCPGLSGHVIERLGLRADTRAYDLVGQGCAAALPNLQLGDALLASGAAAHVLSVCVEVSSAAMYLDNDPGVIVSACLFGDGAGAAVLSRQAGDCRAAAAADKAPRRLRWHDSESLIVPAHRDALRFEQRQGLLRNILTKEVPALAAEHALRVLSTVLRRADVPQECIAAWILHAGGRDVLRAVEAAFGLDARSLHHSAAVLRRYGNLSSAFVYFVLEAALADETAGGWWWLSSFGAGFSVHGALLDVQ